MKDFPPLFLAAAISQEDARANPLSAFTSIGTWYVEPPIRLAFTSNKGVAFDNAFWNTSIGLSLSGEGYVASMYQKYGRVVSPMGCRAFLSPWFERGGMNPADENDKPVFVGRFNIGAISLHLPMIYAKAKKESKDFYHIRILF